MDTVRINNPIESGFARVPNNLWSLPVSIDAKAIFAYLLSFRDGSTVRVALIESALRIGRDKRRKAMAELEALGLIIRVKARNAAGRVLTNELVVDVRPLLLDLLDGESRPTEIQAPGKNGNRPPEKPAAGFSGATGVETRRNRGGKSGDLFKTKTKKGARESTRPASCTASPANGQAAHIAAKAKPEGTGETTGLSWGDLSSFQRSAIAKGEAVFLPQGRRYVQPGDADYRQWVEAHRCEREGLTVAQAAGVH